MSNKPLVIVIVGPTASGKSDLAVKLAKKFKGEIISADSRQVYRRLDIGTGKITKKEMAGIPHYLLDVASPKKQFTVVEFKRLAEKKIAEILRKNKLPIIVGGTGFWIDALILNLSLPNVPPDQKLRRRLSPKKPHELFEILKKIDPKHAKKIDCKNPRRLIRAIEVATALGKIPPVKRQPLYNALWIGVALPKKKLYERIRARLQKRLDSGMINEARSLRKFGLSWKRFYELGLEYKFLADFLKKKIGKKEFIENLSRSIRQYAKRQTTWFKKNKKIRWIKTRGEAEKLTVNFMKK